MNTYSNFKEFYDIKLLPDLKILDGERKQVDRRVLLIVVISIVLIIVIGRLFHGSGTGYFQILIGVLAFIAFTIVSKKYRQNFKNKIVQKITAFVDENLVYSPEGYVSREEFSNSGIFQKYCNSFSGEDHFKGKLGKTEIEFSEIIARHVTTTGTGSKKKEHYKIIFTGVFIVADFNKYFDGHTVVLPDTAERMLGKLGQSLQSMSSRGELVKLEDPEFEKEFCVYSDDQVEARYILSPSLMKRIVDFKRKWNTKVYLSFRDSKVYIAIKMNKNLFETRLFKSIVDYDFIEENIRFLILLTGIVEDLNLNTRIWTKE
jgi:hypothetical protein